jgi:hypothetical protein
MGNGSIKLIEFMLEVLIGQFEVRNLFLELHDVRLSFDNFVLCVPHIFVELDTILDLVYFLLNGDAVLIKKF